MAVKMSTARLANDLGAVVSAKAYLRSMGAPICSSPGCNCDLTHVPTFPRQLEGREIHVDAHFKRAQGSHHSNVCRFNTTQYVNKLVAISRPLDGYEGIFEAVNAGQLAYRLHILTEALEVARRLRATPPAEAEGVFRERRYVRTERVLLPYLRRAKAILALAARVDDRQELAQLVSILHDGVNIHWENFFYHPEDYGRLYRRFIQGPITHPVAVVVHATKHFPARYEGDTDLVSCWFERATRRGREFNIQPRIRCDTQALARRLLKNNWSVVCGIPRLEDAIFPEKPQEDLRKRPFAYLYLDVVSPNQIAGFVPGERKEG